jgi:amino acid adenylation domain-containing protein
MYWMQDKSKKCLVIGQTQLCIACIETLVDQRWHVLLVITEDVMVKDWCASREITTVTYREFLENEFTAPYLFSVVNPYIIPQKKLNDISCLAINYHNSLLPKYAGSNSVTWSILSDEKIHGVTWHLMTESLDGGDVLSQVSFAMEPSETAVSLNLRCVQIAVVEFSKLIIAIESSCLERSKQNIAFRSYFSAKKNIPNAGCLKVTESVILIDRLRRSLTYGSYYNPVGSFKLKIHRDFYVIEECVLNETMHMYLPGEVVHQDLNNITIALKDGTIQIDRLFTFRGKSVSPQELNLQVGDFVPVCANEIVEADDVYYEKALREYTPYSLNLRTGESVTVEFELEDACGVNQFAIAACVMSYFIRVPNTLSQTISFNYILPETLSINKSNPLLSESIPYTLRLDEILKDSLESLTQNLTLYLESWRPMQSDLYYRHNIKEPQLRQSIAIVFDVDSASVAEKIYGIIFLIESKSITFTTNFLFPAGFVKSMIEGIQLFFSDYNHLWKEPLRTLPLLQNSTYRTIVHEWSGKDDRSSEFFPVHFLFERQADETPNNVAVFCENISVTYKQLNAQANQIACQVYEMKSLEKCNQLQQIVGIFMSPSNELIASMVGITKAQATYLVIDTDLPTERLFHILKDSGVSILLVKTPIMQPLVEELDRLGVECIDVRSKTLKDLPASNLNLPILANDLAYLIYTSGTSGMPKKVLIEHESLANTILALNHLFSFKAHTPVLQFSAINFDVFISEVFSAITTGAALHIIDSSVKNQPSKLEAYIHKHRIGAIPGLPAAMLEYLPISVADSLDLIVVGGETISQLSLDKWCKRVRLINAYGPTEATICTTYHIYELGDDANNIGAPIHNDKVFVLSESFEPLPVGVSGELFIGGCGIARNCVDEAGEVSPDLRSVLGSSKLYRTGDWVRWLPNGELLFLGRKDDQIKVRGFRVDPSEVETAIEKINGISKAVVVPYKYNAYDYLIAYYMKETNSTINAEYIRKSLSLWLPQYMVPGFFVEISDFPLTINKKIDKKALPLPSELTNTNMLVHFEDDSITLLAGLWEKVLKVKIRSASDDFFGLGGHSLLAIRLIEYIEKSYSVVVPIAIIYSCSTLTAMAEYIKLQQPNEDVIKPVIRVEMANCYPASSAQKRLFSLNATFEKDYSIYNVPLALSLSGIINDTEIYHLVTTLVNRHESLRTHFNLIDGELVQIISDECPVIIEEMTVINNPNQITKVLTELMQRPFVMESGPLFRVHLLITGAECNTLMLVFHHSIVDGLSLNILYEDIRELCINKDVKEVLQPLSYKDYAHHERTVLLESKNIELLKKYWNDRLDSYFAVIDYPYDNIAHKKSYLFQGDQITYEVDNEQYKLIKQFCNDSKLTVQNFLFGMYGLLLSQYAQQEKLVIGIPVSGRGRSEFENIVGMFSNTLCIAFSVGQETTLNDYFKCVSHAIFDMLDHQEYPYDYLVNDRRGVAEAPSDSLFDFFYSYQIFQGEPNDYLGYYKHWHLVKPGTAKFNMSLNLTEMQCDNKLFLSFEYRMDRFQPSTIHRFFNNYIFATLAAIKNPEILLKNFSVLCEEEKKLVLRSGQSSKNGYPCEQSIIELFEAQARRTPHSIALVYGNDKLSYGELNEKAEQIAVYIEKTYGDLISQSANKVVALYFDRNIDAMITLLAVLKIGFAYLPISTEYPVKQLEYIIQDSQACVLITSETLLHNTIDLKKLIEIVSYEEMSGHTVVGRLRRDKLPLTTLKSLVAYIVYTSGTTGVPKGVVVNHHSLINIILSFRALYRIDENSIATQFASFSFDVFASELFTLLCSGGCLHILPTVIKRDPNLLCDYIGKNKINVMPFIPPVILGKIPIECVGSNLKRVVVGGDKCSQSSVDLWSKYVELINVYGPTETTIWSTYHIYRPSDAANIIGKPFDNNQVYVLDKLKKLCPVGVPGELFISGANVSAGYLNRQDLTVKKFLFDPFFETRKSPGQLMYATGDIVRWSENGLLEYMGRKDFQVKLKGFRIELSAIESVIEMFPNIKKSVVIYFQEPKDQLVAFYVSACFISKENLRQYLRLNLPTYMVPDVLTLLEDIPLDVNGKISRNELRNSYLSGVNEVSANIATGELEFQEHLVRILKNLLKAQDISPASDFFCIGGNSLLAIEFSRLVARDCFVDLPVDLIFNHPKISELAEHLSSLRPSEYRAIRALPENTDCLASSIQESFYLHQKTVGDHASLYSMPLLLQIQSTSELLKFKLETIINTIVQRHEILRTTFDREKSLLLQKIKPVQLIDVEDFGITEIPSDSLGQLMLAIIKKSFDLKNGPLLKAFLWKISENKSLLLINFHHIIMDAFSVKLFANELKILYCGGRLSPIRLQYKDFCEYRRLRLADCSMSSHKLFWVEKFSKEFYPLTLPCDRPRRKQRTFSGAAYEFSIDMDLSQRIKQACFQLKITEHVFLFSSFYLLMARLAKQHDLIIGVPILGRDHPDTAEMMGNFINILPIRLCISDVLSTFELLTEVNLELQMAYKNQEIPLEEIIKLVKGARSSSRHPLFDVMFSYQIFENNAIKDKNEVSVCSFDAKDIDTGYARFDITCFISRCDTDEFRVTFQYSTELFDLSTMTSYSQEYLNIANLLTTSSTLSYPKQGGCHFKEESPDDAHEVAACSNTVDSLYSIWQEVLEIGREDLTYNSDFFSLGGNSLSSMYMLDLLAKQFPNASISLARFQDDSTIRGLVKQVFDKSFSPQATSTRRIIELKRGTDALPTFILPGFIGFASGYQDLALALAGNSAVFGIQMEGLYFEEQPLTTIEAIAEYNIRYIRNHLREGQFNLIAHSFGAAVAFEMTHQLEAGEFDIRLNQLILLDSGPHCMMINRVPLAKLDHVRALFSIISFLLPDEVTRKLLTNDSVDMQNLFDSLMTKDFPGEAIDFILDYAKSHGVSLRKEQLVNTFHVAVTNAAIQYEPKHIINHDINLLCAANVDSSVYLHHELDRNEYDLGWSNYTSGDVYVFMTSGNHISMTKSPHLKKLSAIINRKILIQSWGHSDVEII